MIRLGNPAQALATSILHKMGPWTPCRQSYRHLILCQLHGLFICKHDFGAQDTKQAVQGLQAALEAAHRDLAAVQISASGQGQQHQVLQSHVHDLQSQLAASQAALVQTQVLTWPAQQHRLAVTYHGQQVLTGLLHKQVLCQDLSCTLQRSPEC